MELITKYTVEYIDDLETFKKVWGGKHPAPWTLWKEKEFFDVCEAVTYYLLHCVADDFCDIKISEEIIVDGEVQREEYLEFEPTFGWYLSEAVNRNRQERIDQLEKRCQELNKYLEEYNAFFKVHPALERFFKDFKEHSND